MQREGKRDRNVFPEQEVTAGDRKEDEDSFLPPRSGNDVSDIFQDVWRYKHLVGRRDYHNILTLVQMFDN